MKHAAFRAMSFPFVSVALVFMVVALGVFLRGIPREIDIDSYPYQAMAQGRISEVVQPYANRVLHPFMVHAIARLGVHDIGFIFAGIAVASFFIFAFSIVSLVGNRLPPLGVAAMLCSPVLCLYCVNIYLPDLFYMAQWGLLLLLINRQQVFLGAVLLFLMQLTRESTAVLAVIIIVAAVCKQKWKWAFASGAAVLCGMAAVSWLAREAQPNIHGVNGIFYMGSKAFANAAANILGVSAWTDSYARQLPHMYPEAPVWKMVLPAWLSSGGVKEIGVYPFNPMAPVQTAVIVLSTFGILPVLLFHYVKTAGWRQIKKLPFPLLVPFIAGLAFYFLGPVSGRSVERLVGYGWPVFWVALPLLYFSDKRLQLENEASSSKNITLLWLTQIACQWTPILVSRANTPWGCVVSLVAIAICYCYAWKQLSSNNFRMELQS